jgi:hypothetical protein
LIVEPTANDPESLENKGVLQQHAGENNRSPVQRVTTTAYGETTTLDEGRSSRGSKRSGVTALNKRKRTKQRGKRRRRWGAISRSPKLLGNSSRSVPLTGEVEILPFAEATRFV